LPRHRDIEEVQHDLFIISDFVSLSALTPTYEATTAGLYKMVVQSDKKAFGIVNYVKFVRGFFDRKAIFPRRQFS
jgi:hypothetical protein